MIKRKKLTNLSILICIFISLSGFVYGDLDSDVSPKSNSFTLDECIELALKNNVRIKIKEEEYEKAKVERSEAKHLSDKIDRARDELKKVPIYYLNAMPAGSRIKFEQAEMQTFAFEGAQGKDVAPRLKEAEELVSLKTLELAKQELRSDVEDGYYKALLAEDNLKNAKIQLQRSQEQLKNAQVSYNKGVVAKDSLLMAEAGLANSEQNLFSAEKNLRLAKMSLNKLMAKNLNSPLELSTKFIYKPEELKDVDSFVESALKLRPEVINVREMRDVTKLNADLSLKYYAENTYIYRKALSDAKRAEIGVQEVEDSITLAVHAAYLNNKEMAEKLKSAEKVKSAAMESYRIMDLKYKSQVSTIAELLEAHENLNKAELLYISSVFNYNVSKAELENWAGKGLE